MEDQESEGTSLGLRQFVASRVKEIQALTVQLTVDDASGKPIGGKLFAFQHVPKHMRRRAVSHNPKRLPKRLRGAHFADLAKQQQSRQAQKKKKTKNQAQKQGKGTADGNGEDNIEKKRKTRRFRRKPSNLLLEYNRRQRKIKWLETHIWHAKRFHLESKWNYKIPIRPCEKGFRALYRAARGGVTMRDISFYSCLEICGSFDTICDKFKQFTSPCVNKLSLAAVFYKSGEREGHIHFYKRGMYPFGYIGPVQFIWKPDQSALWLWVHPAYKSEFLDEILSGYCLTQIVATEPEEVLTSSRDETKLESKNLSALPCWTNEEEGIQLTDLEGALNRIRLCGPAALQSLKEMLFLKPSFFDQEQESETTKQQTMPLWFEEFFKEKEDVINNQSEVWSALDPFQGIPCHSVIPLTVRDPRAFLPEKRKCLDSINERFAPYRRKNESKMEEEDKPDFLSLLGKYWQNVGISPIWEANWRTELRLQKMSDAELAKRRGRMLIPGSKIDLGRDENQVPILLVDQPGSGIDLIIPAGWAMPFWVAFSFRCIRPYGLRDALHFTYEAGDLNSHDLMPPDTIPGLQELETEGETTREAFFKKSPENRANLTKLSCPVPFKLDWNLVLSKWSPRPSLASQSVSPSPSICPDFYVLRDYKLVESLSRILNSENDKTSISLDQFPNPEKCLVGVRVFMHGRGHPKKDSVICIPNAEDLEQIQKSQKNKDMERYEISEPDRKDNESCNKRAQMRQEHFKLMALLRKKRKKYRGQEVEHVYDSTQQSRQYNQDMEALWTPDIETIMKTLTKDMIGFLTIGGECYSVGKCAYLGYVSLCGLLEYIRRVKNSSSFVLIRDTRSSLIYRVGRIKIVPLGY